MRQLILTGAWAHRGAMVGTTVAIALAAALVAISGVLIQTGLTGQDETGMLTALAGSFGGTVLLAAILVVTSTVGLALRGRQRDFSLLRAVGATRRQVREIVAAEVLVVALIAIPVGAVLGMTGSVFLQPLLTASGLLPAGGGLAFGVLPLAGALITMVPAAGLAAALATRKILASQPSQAVKQGGAESRALGRWRGIAAVVMAVSGLGSALSPLFVSGTLGGASAATSAFLLVGAAALAGPALVSWSFGRLPTGNTPATQLAVANTKGFSRRLTSAMLPLALVLAAGTVQTSLNLTIERAAERQLVEGLEGTLILPGEADPTAFSRTPGVTAVSSIRSVPAHVKVDQDEPPILESLTWEPTTVHLTSELSDPGVTSGTLADLDQPDTVAISQDATLETGGIGSEVEIRYGEVDTTATVVAVFDRGLGFGDYIIGPATVDSQNLAPDRDAVLLRASQGDETAVAADTGALTPAEYAAHAPDENGAQRLSQVLLLTLLSFFVIAAANTLLMITSRRRGEFAMLHRVGATRRLLLRMGLVEAAITGVVAWLIGTVASIPAILGSNLGLLGWAIPALDVSTFGLLSVVVLILPLLIMAPITFVIARTRSTTPRSE